MVVAMQKRPANRRSLHAAANLQVAPFRYGLPVTLLAYLYRSGEPHEEGKSAPITGLSLILLATARLIVQGDPLLCAKNELRRQFSFIA